MNGLPYYKAYPRDFIEGTVGMDFETKGAYRLVLDLIYMQSGKLPDDARYISGLLGCSVKKWLPIRQRLIDMGKITSSEGYLGNYRADKELDSLKSFQTKQRENRIGKSKNKDLEETMVKPTINHTEPEPKERDKSLSTRVTRFDEFWEVYPHRGGVKRKRSASEAKYRAAVKRGVSEEDLIAGAIRSKRDRQVIDGYARDPTSWLQQEGWRDEIGERKPTGQTKWDKYARSA